MPQLDQIFDDRVLPCSLDAERAVLGSILLHEDAFADAAVLIGADDFFRDAHRRIYLAVASLRVEATSIDLVTLKDELARRGELDEIGGPAYLAALVDGVPRSTNVPAYAAIVKEKSVLRSIIFAANKMLASAYEADQRSVDVIDDGVRTFLAMATVSDGAAKLVAAEALAYVLSLDDQQGADDAMACGFVDLDQMLTGGVRPADLVILGGRPGMGKTSLGLGIARGLARAGKPTVFFSLEMRSREIMGRLISWESRISHQRLRSRFLGEQDYGKLTQAVAALEIPLIVQDSAATLTEVSAWCQRLKREYGIVCAVIDYLQLLIPSGRHASREAEVASLSRGLKTLAKAQDLAVLAISQVNRSPENRKDARPRLSDLRESGAQEADADIVLLVHRPEEYDRTDENSGVAELIVAKNRNGPTGTTRLVFLADLGGKFENFAH